MESNKTDPAVQNQLTDAKREAILKAAKAIKAADALLFTSGAGMSVDSGLPDFRGPQGFWRAYPPMAKLGLKFENMSTPKWFTEDPDFAWGFWAHRISLYSKTNPHAGYATMKRWGEAKNNYFVFTSNVDGHYAKTGYPAEKVYECHGTVTYMQCHAKCTDEIWPTTEFKIPQIDAETFRAKETLPKCKHCNSVASPNVLMFYDHRFLPTREETQEAQFDKFTEDIGQDSKLAIIEIGAGQGVPTVRRLGESLVKQMPNATLVRINWTEEDAKVPRGHISLQMGGLAAINHIDQALSEL